MDDADIATLGRLFNREPSSHKYDFGHVLIVGGAPGMVGAPLLSAMAALRSGAGLATIASSASVIDKLEKRVQEVMTLRLPDDDPAALDRLSEFMTARKVNAIAVGPGLDKAKASFVQQLLAGLQLPVVLDAGGLGAYDGELSALSAAAQHNPDIILTPHQGEFARLIGQGLPAGRATLKQLVSDTAASTGTTIVLKGHRSLVAAPSGETYVNRSGNPGLATAGTGDVLTGIISGLLAQHFNTFDAAKCGVYLHGLAGDLAAAAKTEPGLIASDVIEFIPAALLKIQEHSM